MFNICKLPNRDMKDLSCLVLSATKAACPACMYAAILHYTQALAEWGRASATPATARLRLLLADMSNSPQFTIRVQQTALDVSSLSARALMAGSGATNSPRTASPSTAAGPASAGLGTGGSMMCSNPTSLGTVRMPASNRISAEVLLRATVTHDDVTDEVGADAVQAP